MSSANSGLPLPLSFSLSPASSLPHSHCMCRVAAAAGPFTLHVVLPEQVKKAIPDLVVGSQLRLYEPWDMLAIKSADRSVLIASERCSVVKILDLAKVSLPQVDSILSGDASGFLPAELAGELHAAAADDAGDNDRARGSLGRAVCTLQPVALSRSDAPEPQESYTSIQEMDAWMSEVDVRVSVLRAFPRGALVQEVILPRLCACRG